MQVSRCRWSMRTSCIIAYHASLRIVHPRSLLLISMVPTCAVWAICHVPLMDWSEASTLVRPSCAASRLARWGILLGAMDVSLARLLEALPGTLYLHRL